MMLGELPNVREEGEGYEFVTEFVTDSIHNNGTFYTDSNGFEMVKR